MINNRVLCGCQAQCCNLSLHIIVHYLSDFLVWSLKSFFLYMNVAC